MPDLAMCLVHNVTGVKFGQKIHGIWLSDGNFYFPMSNGTNSEIHVAGPFEFGPVSEDKIG